MFIIKSIRSIFLDLVFFVLDFNQYILHLVVVSILGVIVADFPVVVNVVNVGDVHVLSVVDISSRTNSNWAPLCVRGQVGNSSCGSWYGTGSDRGAEVIFNYMQGNVIHS